MCSGTQEVVLHVDGLTCEGCAWQIREALQKVDGIETVKTTVVNKRVVVTYDPARTGSARAMQALEQIGYKSIEVAQ
jgi:copper chaperone CopZ